MELTKLLYPNKGSCTQCPCYRYIQFYTSSHTGPIRSTYAMHCTQCNHMNSAHLQTYESKESKESQESQESKESKSNES